MVFGDTDVTPTFHSNIGNFFANNSTILISATYRLLPEASHPSGAIDASLAISWAISNSPKYGGCPATSLTIIGHSAGGSCIGTALWGGYLAEDPSLSLKEDKSGPQKEEWDQIINNSTFIFLSAGLWYDVDNPPTSINMPKYHRTKDKARIRREMPVALFREAALKAKAGDEVGWKGPKMKFFLGEWEFDEIVKGTEGCEAAWEEVFGKEEGDGDETENGLRDWM
ncbi:hypothetical protein ONS95_003564 [Cadophora gregata]|uniref:uncharacterized protein n=1 Tax=Cadophora gregata TaxID=51156 RepID=UPI0026DC17DA|nr:uncharacterized protein ONS95_003564 [Cadophora gregata]KAK0106841.1 hypothetical protein ONS95_003564 [Cadophora gregata]